MTTPGVLINGRPSDGRIPVTDSSVLRGDGCFEVIKSYRGRPYRLDEHLARLERSARLLDIQLPPRDIVAGWARECAEGIEDGAVRVVVTRGPAIPGVTGELLVIVFAHPWVRSEDPLRLFPVTAPWHAAGADWELAGAKVLSYAPNMAATRHAQREGFDDALLTTIDGLMLEGPTFSLGWVVDGVIETPGLDLGILDSITRRVVIELASSLGVEMVETRAPLSRIGDADEVFAFSTIREVQSVVAVGQWELPSGPVAAKLHQAFLESVRA
jgi:4-amino-4-deoxychorismate lyase